jgi:hypothetical protein
MRRAAALTSLTLLAGCNAIQQVENHKVLAALVIRWRHPRREWGSTS